jgi:hypothetical protein
MQDQDIPRVELFWTLDDAESALAGSRLSAARLIAIYRHDADGVVVRELNRKAAHEADEAADWLDDVNVFEPGDPPVQVYPRDGERYLRALPAAFSGTCCRAVFIEAGEP